MTKFLLTFFGLLPALITPTLPAKTPNPTPAQFVSIISHGNRNLPQIALTFDADMTPMMLKKLHTGQVKTWYNQKIVEILETKKIPATVFITGMWAEVYPDVVRQLAKDPLFEIANHSYSHPGFTKTCFGLNKVSNKDDEFIKSQKVLTSLAGYTPKFFRFPGGCHNDEDVKLANKHGLTVVDWDDASDDSFNQNRQKIINNIKKNTKNGSILVFHFHGNRNAPLTADVLPEIITYLQSKNFQFVKLSDLVAHL